MKILVFEYITGGGLNRTIIPDSLAREGQMMRDALVRDLCEIDDIEVTLFCDVRLPAISDSIVSMTNFDIIMVNSSDDCREMWLSALGKVDAAWPIAPETDQILADLCRDVENANKLLLTSGSAAVELTGNKLNTYQMLNQIGVDTIETIALSKFRYSSAKNWVIKLVDGVGCDDCQLIQSLEDYQQVLQNCSEVDDWIVQPFVEGIPKSLSALVGFGQAHLLSLNQQLIIIRSGKFELTGCRVNVEPKYRLEIDALLQRIIKNIPGLWGYVGIDYIETNDGAVILEINPRLTTSYAAFSSALDINLASLVMELLDRMPVYSPSRKEAVEIAIAELTTEHANL